MKGFGFSTILLGFVLVTLIVSVGLISFAMYKLSTSKDHVIDDGTKQVTTAGPSAKGFWTDNKLMLVIPTVSNVVSMVLTGVLLVTG